MRKIPDPPAGSGQWRNGWQNGYEQALIDTERAEDHDGPRTWAIEYPPAPPAGTRVRIKDDRVFTMAKDGWASDGDTDYRWKTLLEFFGPLTEVVETEVEAAARRLREAGYTKVDAIDYANANDIATVLAHVLNGGQL